MKTQLNHIDDVISHQIGGITIKLTWTNHGVYTVTTYNGELRIDDNCGTYGSELEARLVARGYAQMYTAELVTSINATIDQAEAPYRAERAQTATIAADVDTNSWWRERQAARAAAQATKPRDFTATRVGCKPPTPAELHAIANHTVTPDGRLVVKAQPGQNWLTLRALHRRIPGEVTYKPGTLIIDSLTYRAEQLAAHLISEGVAA